MQEIGVVLSVGCHPDTVADRSRSIRDAADAEAQRINAAYGLSESSVALIESHLGFNRQKCRPRLLDSVFSNCSYTSLS